MSEREYNARGMPLLRRPEFPAINCRDCGRMDDDYMVEQETWCEAFDVETTKSMRRAPKGRLCLDCLENRLGRPLTIEDFRCELPINRKVVLGYSLARDKIDAALEVLKACARNPNEMLEEVEGILEGGPRYGPPSDG
jgi:hypothetical protein